MRRRKLWVTGVAAVVAAVAVGGVAIAASNNGPRTTAVTATFQAAPERVKTNTCVGQDGAYLEIKGNWRGTIQSSDPRLTGTLEFSAQALVNTNTGLGTFEGRFHVRTADGRSGANGTFYTVVTEGNLNHGFAVGKVAPAADPGTGAGTLHANFESTVGPTLAVVGQLGGPGQPRDPAVIQEGSCSGGSS